MQNLDFVTAPTPSAEKAEEQVRRALKDVKACQKMVVAIGGDGTMLQAVKRYLHEDVIFIGVSAGSLGLLQTIEPSQLDKLAEALASGRFHLLRAPLMYARYCRPGSSDASQDEPGEIIGYAFNDISIERQVSRTAKFHLKINGSSGNFIGDGVIFSTPLGSTAYSLAAGGPVIDSDIQDVFVVTPNNPHLTSLHSSLQRPHVLSRNRTVRIEVNEQDTRERPLQLAIDGEIAVSSLSAPVNIGLSDLCVRLLQLEADSIKNRIESKRLGRM